VTSNADARSRTARSVGGGTSLRHVMVVGGTLAEWTDMSADDWHKRVDELGSYCASIGVPWLTIRVYEATGDPSDGRLTWWTHEVHGCSVAVDPTASGRERFASAMRDLDPAAPVTEAAVIAALYEPADCEPDLLVVLGPPTQLPPSLVWELAYAELVFLPVGWKEFAAADLAGAVVDFAGRRRRFGGLDDE
jgi:undecaprenyl diphosphate synthase